jgi:hypothetical protein
MQYKRLDGTNFSKNSSNLSCATENETWSVDKSQMLLAMVLFALCSLLVALCSLLVVL